MSFYSSISEAYDDIFPFNPVQLEFVESCLEGAVAGKCLVDAGCGTGSLAIMLARRSAKVIGFDADEEMIKVAEQKRPQALNLRFKTGDLIEEFSAFKKNSCDAVLCFGNTLVHLNDFVQIGQFVQRALSVLKPGGKLLIQIVNYDRILNDNVKELPVIETVSHVFERSYVLTGRGYIEFKTVLTNKYGGETLSGNVILFPVRKDPLERLLKKYFSKAECFGDFKKNKWNNNSFHLVIKAEKL